MGKIIERVLIGVGLILIIFAVGYVRYMQLSYFRISDHCPLTVGNNQR